MNAKLKISGYAESTVRAYWDFFDQRDSSFDSEDDEDDADLRVLASAYNPKTSTITITDDTIAAIRRALCVMANTEDETYERERSKAPGRRDVETRDYARHAARGLSTLYAKVCAIA